MADSEQSLLTTLIQLASDKEIPYTPSQIKKMSQEKLEEVYREYKVKELDSVNETIADMLIVKFEGLLKSNSWIKPDSKLGTKLQDSKLFKRDIKVVISYVTPFLPFMGLLEGALVVSSEVVDNYTSQGDNKSHEQDDPPKAEEGSEQDPPGAE